MKRPGTGAVAAKWIIGIPAAGLLCWFVLMVSIAGVFRARLPDMALRLAPFDARAQANKAQRALLTRRDPDTVREAHALARAALRRDPTAADAAAALGMIFALRNQAEGAERSFAYAQFLTRRDVPTQLWLLERNVQRDDIAGALAHFDIILRTSPPMAATLFPILVNASREPPIAAAINRLLRDKPVWWSDFVSAMLMAQQDPVALYRVTRGLMRSRQGREGEQLEQLLERLTALGAFDLAWRAHADVHPDRRSAGAGLWNGDFARPPGLPPFDWTFPDDPTTTPERRPRGGDYALYLPAGAPQDVEAARQLLRLEPGRYVLSAEVGGVAGDEALRPQMAVRCAGPDARELVRSSFPSAPEAGAPLRLGFAVPGDCRYQWISIWARGAFDRQSDDEPWIGSIRLSRS